VSAEVAAGDCDRRDAVSKENVPPVGNEVADPSSSRDSTPSTTPNGKVRKEIAAQVNIALLELQRDLKSGIVQPGTYSRRRSDVAVVKVSLGKSTRRLRLDEMVLELQGHVVRNSC
jgi:hypothetical protein